MCDLLSRAWLISSLLKETVCVFRQLCTELDACISAEGCSIVKPGADPRLSHSFPQDAEFNGLAQFAKAGAKWGFLHLKSNPPLGVGDPHFALQSMFVLLVCWSHFLCPWVALRDAAHLNQAKHTGPGYIRALGRALP